MRNQQEPLVGEWTDGISWHAMRSPDCRWYRAWPHLGRWRLKLTDHPDHHGLLGQDEMLWEADDLAGCQRIVVLIEEHRAAVRRYGESFPRDARPIRSLAVPDVEILQNGSCIDAMRGDERVGRLSIEFSPWSAFYVTGELTINCGSWLGYFPGCLLPAGRHQVLRQHSRSP